MAADNTRQFTLIGNFTDNITQPLGTVNTKLEGLLTKLESYKTKFGELAELSKTLGSAAKESAAGFTEQAAAVTSASNALRAYATNSGRANRSIKGGGIKLLNSIGKNRDRSAVADARAKGALLQSTAKADATASLAAAKIGETSARAAKTLAATDQIASKTAINLARAEQMSARASRGGGGPPGGPPGGGGGRRGGGGYYGGYGDYGPSAGLAFGQTLGNTLSGFMTGAIVGGFEIGVKLMALPFQYVAGAFKERIADEMSDIQAAGGLYVTDIRKSLGLFKNFGEALRTQEQLNARLSMSARDLPGETAEYVRQAKRLEDTFAKALGQDPVKFQKFGESLGAKVGDKLDSFQVIVQKFTEKAVLLSQGTRGAAGTSGVYGLPQLLEILINKEKVNVQALEVKYASLRDNPLLASALKDAEAKLERTGAGSADRIAEVFKVLEEALPNEVIQRIRQSTASILETIRSTFLDPETGLFGLGRKLKITVPRVNEFGQYLTKFGRVTQDVNLAAQDSTSIFDLLKNTLSGFVLPLVSLSDILFELYNPLEAVGVDLVAFRNIAQNFYYSFNAYTKDFEILSKQLNSVNIGRTAAKRGALLAIANLLRFFKVIEDSDFAGYVNKLKDPRASLKNIASELFGKLFDSEFMRQVGETVGKVVGGALQAVAGFLSGTSSFVTSSKFAKGFAEGFDQRKGLEAVKTIFQKLAELFLDAFKSLFAVTPLSLKLIAGLALFIPAITAAIGAALVNGIGGVISRCFSGGGLANAACGAGGGRGGRGGRGGGGGGLGGFFGPTERVRKFRNRQIGARARYYRQKASQIGGFGAEAAGLGYNVAGRPLAKVGGAIGKVGRLIPGGALAGGAISGALSLASGSSPMEAFKDAAFSVIGGAVGSFAGPWGTAAGITLGPVIGNAILNSFTKPATALEKAATALEQVDKGAEKYGDQYSALGTLDATFGGGSGIKKYAEEQLKIGAITPEQAKAYKNLSKNLTNANIDLDEFKVAEADYRTALGLAKGKETKLVLDLKNKRDRAEKDYLTSIATADKNWQGMSGRMQGGLLAASKALEDFAARVYGIQIRKPPGNPPGPVLPPTEALKNQYPDAADTTFVGRGKYIGEKRTDRSGRTGTWNGAKWSFAAKGSLGDAVSKEISMKPAGSSLVVANSSETIIPAAGGNGVGALINTFRSGLISIATSLKEINNTLKLNQQQTNARLMKLETKFTTPGGSLGGSIGGSGIFGSIASGYGLTMTSGYRPGDPGYHGVDRARDYSNSTGPTPQMLGFAQFIASAYGRNLKELIYTPLGYSIKNGQRVPPYAQGQHYNHVHLAYATGYGMPLGTAAEAMRYEKAMTPGSVKVASITGNSAEGFGSGTTIQHLEVNINAGGVQNHDELASIVVRKIEKAVLSIGNSYYS
jgi:hypothetical protein